MVLGGLGRHVAALSRALADQGHEVRVLTRGTGPAAQVTRDGLVLVHRAAVDPLDLELGSASMLAWAQAFEHSLVRAGSALLRRWRPDVVHAHDWLTAQTAETLHAQTGARRILTLHAAEHGRRQGWLDEALPRAIHSLERWQVARADRVIVCSSWMAGQVGQLFGVAEHDLAVIGNGIGLPDVSSSPPSRRAPFLEPPETGPRLLFAGRLVHEKGLQELVKALPLLAHEWPGIELAVAGDGPDLAAQQDRAERYGVRHRVHWHGFLEAEDLAVMMAAADAVVVPSLYEPFGMVALEAQALSVPVAASAVGGLPELVTDGVTGRLFAPESPVAIAEAVAALLRDPTGTRAMTEAARHAAARFTWPSLARRTAAVYDSSDSNTD